MGGDASGDILTNCAKSGGGSIGASRHGSAEISPGEPKFGKLQPQRWRISTPAAGNIAVILETACCLERPDWLPGHIRLELRKCVRNKIHLNWRHNIGDLAQTAP